MDLTMLPATELARLVRNREAGVVEVVEAHLRRIEATHDAIKAVVQLDGERALATARAGDRGAPAGALHGVPFTVKDNLEAEGIPMAIGAPERAGAVPAADATAVARLKGAGAILFGKTNCPPWGGGIETDNPVYGRTSNPYDTARTPGGSSGGEAAIVAAGASALGLGTDSGASVRLPAHFCGLAALKPTAGRVPVTGVIDDEGPIGALGDPRTQVGPLGRSVEDVALALRVIAGPDGRDGGIAPCRSATTPRSACGASAWPCRRTAPRRRPRRRPWRWSSAPPARCATPAPRWSGRAIRAAGTTSPSTCGARTAAETSAAWLYRLLRRWDAFRTEMLAFAERYGAILCPVFGGPAPLHGTIAPPGQLDPTGFTTPHSLTGWPAATVRCGSSPEGLPIGVQVVARPWRDDVALALALRLERDLGGYVPPAL